MSNAPKTYTINAPRALGGVLAVQTAWDIIKVDGETFRYLGDSNNDSSIQSFEITSLRSSNALEAAMNHQLNTHSVVIS